MIRLSRKQIDTMASYMEKQEDVLAFYLYGSYGTEYQTILSDVDFAVLPFSKKELDIDRELELLSELQLIGRSDDINMVNLLKVPVTLQMRVLESGRLLFCRIDVFLADFKELVIRRYCDFEPDPSTFYRDYDAGLREEFL
jgi:predicted nucleotidyltransferase